MTSNRRTRVLLISLACVGSLVACTDPGVKAARAHIGDVSADVEDVRQSWSPTMQKATCGRIKVGHEYRRFVALLTSDGKTASGAMVEGASPEEKTAFGETIYGPACGPAR